MATYRYASNTVILKPQGHLCKADTRAQQTVKLEVTEVNYSTSS